MGKGRSKPGVLPRPAKYRAAGLRENSAGRWMAHNGNGDWRKRLTLFRHDAAPVPRSSARTGCVHRPRDHPRQEEFAESSHQGREKRMETGHH